MIIPTGRLFLDVLSCFFFLCLIPLGFAALCSAYVAYTPPEIPAIKNCSLISSPFICVSVCDCGWFLAENQGFCLGIEEGSEYKFIRGRKCQNWTMEAKDYFVKFTSLFLVSFVLALMSLVISIILSKPTSQFTPNIQSSEFNC
ncbi:hypothetical protein pv_140 [Pithovirus sibericum]|uniref:Transmembrane protein n=1 Tax=Pithovirus sibericum TaxID=1450746 RepID=W5S5Y5_9VIRU|nr:hypothetical protein pv_140 [Pithovirus sibericum]AHH01707.1 hypothetical protein pv_140 [Pithovirus sibericum]